MYLRRSYVTRKPSERVGDFPHKLLIFPLHSFLNSHFFSYIFFSINKPATLRCLYASYLSERFRVFYVFCTVPCIMIECVWNLMAHGDARERKWRGNWRTEWVASTLTLPRNMVYSALLTLMRTPRLPVVDWTEAPADLNGLVHFDERRNLVSAHVPSRFKCTLQLCNVNQQNSFIKLMF